MVGSEEIRVRLRDSDVTLTGTVHPYAHHDAAIAAAASAPGVMTVDDEVTLQERCSGPTCPYAAAIACRAAPSRGSPQPRQA